MINRVRMQLRVKAPNFKKEDEDPTSPMDADRLKHLGGRVMGAPRYGMGEI